MSKYNYVYDKEDGNIYLASTMKYIHEGEVYNRDIHNNYLVKKLYKEDLEEFFDEVGGLSVDASGIDRSNLVYFNKLDLILSIRKQVDSAKVRFADIRDHLLEMRKEWLSIQKKIGMLLRFGCIIEGGLLISLILWRDNIGLVIAMVILGLLINPILIHWVYTENVALTNKILKLDYTLKNIDLKEYIDEYIHEKQRDLSKVLETYYSHTKVELEETQEESTSEKVKVGVVDHESV